MTHLTVLKINPRLLSPRAGELEHRGCTADALELNDIGDVQVAQRPLKTLACLVSRGEKRLDQHHKISSRKRFLEKMNRAEAGDLLTLRGEMDRRQNNGAGIGMTRAQIVDELLPKIVGCVNVEDKKRRLLVDDQLLRFA